MNLSDKQSHLKYLTKMRKIQNDNATRSAENAVFHIKNRKEIDKNIKKLKKEIANERGKSTH